jgi:hypothetical protein
MALSQHATCLVQRTGDDVLKRVANGVVIARHFFISTGTLLQPSGRHYSKTEIHNAIFTTYSCMKIALHQQINHAKRDLLVPVYCSE